MTPQIRIGWACLGGPLHRSEAQAYIDQTTREPRTDPYERPDHELPAIDIVAIAADLRRRRS